MRVKTAGIVWVDAVVQYILESARWGLLSCGCFEGGGWSICHFLGLFAYVGGARLAHGRLFDGVTLSTLRGRC